MKKVLALAALFLGLLQTPSGHAAAFNIATAPSVSTVKEQGMFRGSSATFLQMDDGEMVICVRLLFLNSLLHGPSRSTLVFFKPQRGQLIREGAELYWIDGSEKFHVARRTWWQPDWKIDGNIRINYRVDQMPNNGQNTYNVSAALTFYYLDKPTG